jgi:hypothetical protein
MADLGSIHGASDGGMAGNHSSTEQQPVMAGTSTESQSNLIRMPLIPVACWKVEDVRFVFDSSFILPEARDEMGLLESLIQKHTRRDPGQQPQAPPVSLFGHADPVGTDDYNKHLSGRRAAVIYGMVTRRPEIWEDLYSDGSQYAIPCLGDKWGTRSIQIMLTELGFPATADGQMGPQTSGALQGFQNKNGLPASGSADSGTRNKLYLAYMNQVCVDSSGQPFQIDKVSGFLAQNADPMGKGDFQGCSEFNPVLLFSQQDEDFYQDPANKVARDAANQPNRRVVGMLFRPGSLVLTTKWPCPRAKEDTTGCRKRFWSNGEARRSTLLPDQPRKYEKTKDTFACRFYDRLTHLSPCEHTQKPIALRWIGWVPDGLQSESSVELNHPNGDQIGTLNGTSYKVAKTAGVCQRYDFSLDPKSFDFELAMIAQGSPFIPPVLFQLRDLIRAQQEPDDMQKAVQVNDLDDSEES